MPRVPVGNKYKATMTGAALKPINCSYCGCQFVYQIKRQASEFANVMAAGQQNIKTDVAAELEKLYELKQKGILTDEEYNNRNTKILNS